VVDFRLPRILPNPISVKDNILSEIGPAVAALEKSAAIDGHRIGFWGFSYGGYTALTLLAYTNLFRAIVAMAPLGDLSEYAYAHWPETQFTPCWPDVTFTTDREVEGPGGQGDRYAFIRMGAPEYLAPRKYNENSPSLHMRVADTPTLVGSGDMDVFANGALPTYLALTRKGVPAEFVQFYGEGHVLQSPGNIAARCAITLTWFDRYVKHTEDDARTREICGTAISGS
jgi:dipeptidyl aminopeptidase/acylaminoacyl peptidase